MVNLSSIFISPAAESLQSLSFSTTSEASQCVNFLPVLLQLFYGRVLKVVHELFTQPLSFSMTRF